MSMWLMPSMVVVIWKGRQGLAMLGFVHYNKEFEIYFKCEGKPLDMFQWVEDCLCYLGEWTASEVRVEAERLVRKLVQ